MFYVSGSKCCSKVLVGSTGQARVDQALYMGIYARYICIAYYVGEYMHLCNVSILKKLSLKYNRTFFSLPDTQQTTMVRRSTGGRGERLSTSTSSPGETHKFPIYWVSSPSLEKKAKKINKKQWQYIYIQCSVHETTSVCG